MHAAEDQETNLNFQLVIHVWISPHEDLQSLVSNTVYHLLAKNNN